MAQQVKVHITIAGESVSPFSGVSISQDINQHHTFEISLPADAFKDTGKAILEQSKKYIGQECHIRFSPDLFRRDKGENEFIGIVTEVRLNRSSQGKRTILLMGYSPTILMEGHSQCRAFYEMSVSEIASSMLESIPHSLEAQINPSSSPTLPYVLQYYESNYKFLQRMAARIGQWCFYNGTKLIFGELPRDQKVNLPLVKDLFNLDFSFKLLPVNFNVYAYNYEKNEVYQSKGADVTVNDLDEYGKFALEESGRLYSQEPSSVSSQLISGQQELDSLAVNRKTATASNLVMMNGTSDNPFLNVGSIINITGETKSEQDYGEFVIISLQHAIGESYDYQNSFTAIPAEIESPPPPSVPEPVCSTQPAVVVDHNDPDQLGRVKVKFPWQDEVTTPWIRVSQVYGASNADDPGFYFVPEIDTEVMVGFEHNNPEKPFVLSSVYHLNSAPSAAADPENQTKIIRTRSGNQVHFIDEDGKEKIRIFQNDDSINEICLEMDGDGKITIKTAGLLDISAKSINIEAQENIDINAGTDFNLTVGGNLKTDVTSNLEQKANAVSISANTDVGIEGGTNVEVSGGVEVNVDGGVNTSVKGGAELSLEGSAMASLKGGLVRIN